MAITDSVQLADLRQLITKREVTVENCYLCTVCTNHKNADTKLTLRSINQKDYSLRYLPQKENLTMIAVKVTIFLLLAKCTEFEWPLPKGNFLSVQLN